MVQGSSFSVWGAGVLVFRVPIPHTPHPTPYTLHPTPYALHPTPDQGLRSGPKGFGLQAEGC